MAKQGRKLILNEEMIKKIATAFEYGNYATVVCDYVGITTVTLAKWLHNGEELQDKDPSELTDDERLFVSLFSEVRKARSLSEMRAVERIRQAGERDWKANAWFLERTATTRWGKVERHELTGADGGAIEVSAEAVERKLQALLANSQALIEGALENADDKEIVDATLDNGVALIEAVGQAIMARSTHDSDNEIDDSSGVELDDTGNAETDTDESSE
jgi:hypothetical protein